MAEVTASKKTGQVMSGFVLGVEFINGRAETESPTALAFFRQSEDYAVTEKQDIKAKAADAGDK